MNKWINEWLNEWMNDLFYIGNRLLVMSVELS